MSNISIAHGKALPALTLAATGTVSWSGVVRAGHLSIYAAWTGAPTGVFSLRTSFDGGTTWVATPGASAEFTANGNAQPAGSASAGMWNWTNVPGTSWQILYTATSGTGALTGYSAQSL